MESSVTGVAKFYHFVPSPFISDAKHFKIDSCFLPSHPSLSLPFSAKLKVDQSWSPIRRRKQEQKTWKELNCTKGSFVSFPEKQQLQSQFGNDESITEEELMNLGKEGDKCKEVSGGMAELLECLESEAIMGDDEGKEPTDYNRRSQIFDKSSRVFQGLKHNNAGTSVD